MTYRKIAQLAGVSLSTVSKALAGSGEISEETAQRIWKIAEEYGVARPTYRKNRTSLRVAVMVPEIVSVFYSTYATEIANELRKQGIEPAIYLCGFSQEKIAELIDRLVEDELADGIVILTEFACPRRLQIPIVQLTSKYYPGCDTIASDIESGILEAVRYLSELGHRKIGFVSEKNTQQKLDAFRSAMGRLALPQNEKYVFISDKRFAAIGEEAADYYLKFADRPTALLCAYDEVALGAIHVFKNNGVRIPEDISIIGINDIPSAAYASVPLTTISTYSVEMMQQCVKMLLDHMKKQENHMIQNIRVGCRLIVRDTTARVREDE